MQSREQRYREHMQQDDFFNRDLEDAHLRNRAEAAHTPAQSNTPAAPGNSGGGMAERFMRSLQQIETTGDVEPLVNLFAEDADLINLAMQHPLQGQQSIRQFWQNYLSMFDRIHSRFTHVAEGNGTITLEWISEGALSSGEPFSYRGVSVLETENDRVKHFRTYYDSAAFLPNGAK